MHPNRSFSEHAKKFWIFPKGIEGGKLNKLIIRHDAALKATLNEQSSLSECEGFVNGFRLSVRLIAELFCSE